MDVSKINSSPSTYQLGYMLDPRINAGGRVGKCSHGANLLIEKNPKICLKLQQNWNNDNKERQMLERDLLNKILQNSKDFFSDPVLILHGSN